MQPKKKRHTDIEEGCDAVGWGPLAGVVGADDERAEHANVVHHEAEVDAREQPLALEQEQGQRQRMCIVLWQHPLQKYH